MNASPILECVPNFSEGVDPEIVRKIVASMRVEGVRLLDYSLDPDHNRSVVTIAGTPAAVMEAAILAAGRAAHLIDLMERDGLVGPADGSRPRELLKSPGWLHEVAAAQE